METGYHETGLSEEAKDLHRGLVSLIEELQAIDWYMQRIDVSRDGELNEVLTHNRNEEMEHAAMNLEWLRRRIPYLDAQLHRHLFHSGPIVSEKEVGGTTTPAVSQDLGIGRSES